eukprot:COSAG02_NODE_60_length_43475_cov_59.494582_20_plen_167_part_00
MPKSFKLLLYNTVRRPPCPLMPGVTPSTTRRRSCYRHRVHDTPGLSRHTYLVGTWVEITQFHLSDEKSRTGHGPLPGKRPSRWPGAWQTAISPGRCLANGHLASQPWPNAWQTAILRGARIRKRRPSREAILTPFVCTMAQRPANGHLVRAPPLRRLPRTLALGRR